MMLGVPGTLAGLALGQVGEFSLVATKAGVGAGLLGSELLQIVLDVAKDADVFLQNFRPGAVDRLRQGRSAPTRRGRARRRPADGQASLAERDRRQLPR